MNAASSLRKDETLGDILCKKQPYFYGFSQREKDKFISTKNKADFC